MRRKPRSAGKLRRFSRALHRPALGLVVVLYAVFGLDVGTRLGALAADLEILTPRSGATVLARKPLTHLVLRQAQDAGGERPWVQVSGGRRLESSASGQHQGHTYLHFQLPLKSGLNTFEIGPAGQRFQLTYQPLTGRFPASLKNVDLFHREDRLPETCTACHSLQNGAPIAGLGVVGQEACLRCHRGTVAKAAWKHSPFDNKLCLACHQQSATPWRFGFPVGRIEDSCFACHTGKRRWVSHKYPHAAMTLGGCTLCHDPHGDANRYQLWAEGSVALCVTCHSDKETLLPEGKRVTPPKQGKGGKPEPAEPQVSYVHGVINGPGCVACHDPHATGQRFMLRQPTNQLCVGCHPKLAGVTFGHPVARHPVAAPKERRRPDRPLTCVGCHDPHGTENEYMLIGTTLGGQFCRECHKKQ
ncbi:MAG: cytochrome c3 family protein [Deltaproteobacteria bacterium]|nr:cytochrome c3 family protein [Deltaproteobacteria bacterium]